MLREEDKKQITERFADLKGPLKLILFTQKVAGTCQYCAQTEELLREVAELSDLLELEIVNFVTDKDKVEEYGIDKIPALVIQSEEDTGIRFYGMPSGYEFATLMETLIHVSGGDPGLSDQLRNKIKTITAPVHIQVFVTPTCPYCPKAAITAFQLAMENENIKADVIEVTEFPHLAQKYAVMGVPKVVLNEDHSFEGAIPEPMYIDHVIEAQKS